MADLIRVSIMGALPNGEKWSINPVWGLSDFPVSTTPAQIVAIANAVNGISTGSCATPLYGTSTVIVGVRVEARTFAGVLQNQAEAVRATPVAGTGTSVHPFQTSLVASLRTQAVGASGRGRLYYPATGILLDSDTLRPTLTTMNTLTTAVKTHLAAIETAVKATFPTAKLGVWSRKNASVANVVSLQLGDIPDVQRRRRDALNESYNTVAFP